MYRYSILLGLCLATAAGMMAPLGAAGARSDAAMLKRIGSRIDGRTGVIAIEASTPVPYVASQPDARTFVVELRDVVTAGFEDGFTADPRNPIAAVRVENSQAFDGATVARVRLTLNQPMRPRVRSARNVIYVEADRVDAAPSVNSGVINLAGPATAIRDVRAAKRGNATALTLLGTARLVTTSIQEPKDGTPRLVLDMPNVTSSLPSVTSIKRGPVDRVRIGASPRSPLLTQVTVELTRAAAYRVESSPDGNDLTLVFDEPVNDPIAALKTPNAPVLRQAPPPGVEPARIQPGPQAQIAAPAAQAPAAQAPAAQPPQPAAAQAQRYTGNPVSLDFQGADLRAVLRTFSEISGLNLVIDPTINGTVDVALRDVPWDQALDIILRANKLGYVVDGSIVRIAPLTVLAAEEEERRKLSDAQALAGELQVLTRSLSYARAADLRELITTTILSQRGSIQFDNRTNTIIIQDLADRLERAGALITTLDRAEPQVEIEARIVQTTREFARRLGVQWGFNGQATPALGNTLPTAFPNQVQIGGRTGNVQGPGNGGDAVSNAVNLGVGGASSAVGLALGSINGAVNLDIALSAIERQGQGRILSTPKVSTQNNIEAEITQGIQIPIQTVANNTVTVSFRDAALTLRVTPQITAANTVIMRIAMENSAPDFSRAVNGIPPIDTQRALTQVLVSNGETTVIGGIYVSREQSSQDRTPALHRLPLLGWLF
ncbi:MAG TPA: type IV pilus secretin PilQ, partial [Vicinamibacterales bacterium]|nr:type IV pilus secretin PilQ [Vicinamibacterales bacterium]